MSARGVWARYRLELAYHGGAFHGSFANPPKAGWGEQRPLATVMGALEESLKAVIGPKGEIGDLQAASRTDAGVHALQNVAHVDLRRHPSGSSPNGEPLSPQRLRMALNSRLHAGSRGAMAEKTNSGRNGGYTWPENSVTVTAAQIVHKGETGPASEVAEKESGQKAESGEAGIGIGIGSSKWHCRRGVAFKTYCYRLAAPSAVSSQPPLPIFALPFCHLPSALKGPLDVAAMREAAKQLEGTKDFSSFKAAGCSSFTPIKTLYQLSVHTDDDDDDGDEEPILVDEQQQEDHNGEDDDGDDDAAGAKKPSFKELKAQFPADAMLKAPGPYYGKRYRRRPADFFAGGVGLGLGGGFLSPQPASSGGNNRSRSRHQSGYQGVSIIARGDSFLYNQVRIMAGLLIEVGKGKIAPDRMPEILAVKERSKLPFIPTAPAHGLFLAEVAYKDDLRRQRRVITLEDKE